MILYIKIKIFPLAPTNIFNISSYIESWKKITYSTPKCISCGKLLLWNNKSIALHATKINFKSYCNVQKCISIWRIAYCEFCNFDEFWFSQLVNIFFNSFMVCRNIRVYETHVKYQHSCTDSTTTDVLVSVM